MISDNRLKTWKTVADESAQDISTLEKLDHIHSMEVLFPEYFWNIPTPRKIFPCYGIGQNYGNWIFQPLLQYFQKIPYYGRGPILPVPFSVMNTWNVGRH